MKRLLEIALAILVAQTAPPQTSLAPASLYGIVVDVTTGDPVPGVEVALERGVRLVPGEGLMGPAGAARRPEFAEIAPVITDAKGRFSFERIETGSLGIRISSDNYVQASGTRVANDARTSIVLGPGEAKRDVVVRVTETGVIAGLVLTETGQPGVGVAIQVWRAQFGTQFPSGDNSRVFRTAHMTSTDDRGQYRIPAVSPGIYYLTAGAAPGQAGNVPANVQFVYHPGVTDVSKATPIRVRPRAEIRADFATSRFRGYAIRGVALDSRTGQPPKDLRLTLRHGTDFGGSTFRPNYDAATGVFGFEGVPSGGYTLVAQAVPQLSRDPAEVVLAAPVTSALITVAGADVEGLRLTLSPPFELAGRIRIDGKNGAPEIPGIGLRLLPGSGAVLGVATSSGRTPDGGFKLAPLKPGEYVVRIGNVPAGFYVKDVRFEQTDALNQPLQFSGPSSESLQVVLSRNVSRVRGTVTDTRSRPAPNVQAVLVPERRDRADLYRATTTDTAGLFTLSDVPPGNYKLFAWAALDPLGYFDPDVLKDAEERGIPVRVEESSDNSLNAVLP